MKDATKSVSDACSLDASSLQERLAMIRREIGPHVVARRIVDGGVAWEFPFTPEMLERLERLAEAERRCCGGWRFEVRESRTEGRLCLEVHGAGADSALLDILAGVDT